MGSGGQVILQLRDEDASGKVELWVYDDGTMPADPKAHRVGPRWGLLQKDGTLLAIGILHATYLGGNEGYTAAACDGKDWFKQLFWRGTCFFGFEEPVENMPQHGLEYGRVAGISALLLCTDLPPERKELLLLNYVQVCSSTRCGPIIDQPCKRPSMAGRNRTMILAARRPLRRCKNSRGIPDCINIEGDEHVPLF